MNRVKIKIVAEVELFTNDSEKKKETQETIESIIQDAIKYDTTLKSFKVKNSTLIKKEKI